MLSIDNATDTFRVVMAAAVTTTAPDYYVTYVDITTTAYTPAESHGALNGVTPVTVVAAPAASTQRVVKFISIFNRDTVSHTLTVSHWDTSTDIRIWVGTVQPGEMMQYTDMGGWVVIDSQGIQKAAGSLGIGAVAAGGSTLSRGTVILSNSNEVSFSINNNSLEVAQGPTQRDWGNGDRNVNGFGTISNALPVVYPAYLNYAVTGTKMDLAVFWNLAANAASSAGHSATISVGFYRERSCGILSLYTSVSTLIAYTYSSNTNTSNWTGCRVITFPFNVSLSAGQWWPCFFYRSSTSGNALTYQVSWAMHGGDLNNAPNGYLGIIRYESMQFRQGAGYMSNSTFTTAMPNEFSMNWVNHGSVARYVRPVMIGLEA